MKEFNKIYVLILFLCACLTVIFPELGMPIEKTLFILGMAIYFKLDN